MQNEILSATRWTDLVAAIQIITPVKFPIKHKSTIRFEISGKILKEYPDRIYKTWTDKEAGTITVYRVK